MKQFLHACKMVWRNRRSYALLSVTVVLTFSFLLGYLVYTDTALYNRHKKRFLTDRNVFIATAQFLQPGQTTDGRINSFLYAAEQQVEMDRYSVLWTWMKENRLPAENEEGYIYFTTECYFVPSTVWELYDFTSIEPFSLPITWLDGKKHEGVHLESRQILMESSYYYLLGLDKMDTSIFSLQMQSYTPDSANAIPYSVDVEVVGIFQSSSDNYIQAHRKEKGTSGIVFAPMSLLEQIPNEIRSTWHYTRHEVCYTETPEVLGAIAEGIELNSVSDPYRLQDLALADKQQAQNTKAIIAAALFVILGISLYSCFTNALNDRKFEIGVKRAVGVSGWGIIRQFLVEGILVMGFDIILSIILIGDIAVVFRYVTPKIPAIADTYGNWIMYISPQSIGMFLLCSVGLTVGFSLIFAYQTTQVQIVDYLKAE